MVIKTETCAFSEFRIYPGHGSKFVRTNGLLVNFSSAKCKSLYLQRKKPAKLTWTQAWRRLNKKMKSEEVTKKRSRKSTKFQRAIVGVSLEEIKKKREQKPEYRSLQRDAALKEVKAKKKEKASKAKAGGGGPGAKPSASKQKGAKGGAARGSTGR